MSRGELDRVLYGPASDDEPDRAAMVEITADCPANAAQVLDKTKSALALILRNAKHPWPPLESWRSLLPPWLVAEFRPERTKEESAAFVRWWDGLSWDEKRKHVQEPEWTLSNWLSCFDPDDRHWFWWDAAIEGGDTLRVEVEVDGWPVPLSDLEWLLRSAGAIGTRVAE